MNTRSALKFVLVPAHPHRYDRRMMRGLADAFYALGHEALTLLAPVTPRALVGVCEATGADVVIQVNRLRPFHPELPPNTQHIAWFQDVFPSDQRHLGRVQSGDIVYFLGDPKVLGLNRELPCLAGTLVTGVEESLLDYDEKPDFECDYSLAGFIPPFLRGILPLPQELYFSLPPLAFLGGLLSGGLAAEFIFRNARVQAPEAVLAALRSTVEMYYRPLSGELDITVLSKMLRDLLDGMRWRYGLAPRRIHLLVDYYTREYPRLLDRLAMLHAITDVSDSVHLYGPGWDGHDEFRTYHRGMVHSLQQLARIYRTSRINLANNTHGLGLHSRNLECMAVGGFVFTHTSPNDDKPGGMHTAFEPGVHYGAFTPQTMVEESQRWLRDKKARMMAGERAREIVRDKHLWRHRAEQILADLRQ